MAQVRSATDENQRPIFEDFRLIEPSADLKQ
jgi:hypothetical protein